jgi:hypothetical protein
VAKKPTVTIKVPGRHSDTSVPGIVAVLEAFLLEAEVFGNVQAILGPAVRGHQLFAGPAGVRVVKFTSSGVEVKAQTEDRGSRRVFVLNPPTGLATDKFFTMLQKAEAKLSAARPSAPPDLEDDEPVEEVAAVPATPAETEQQRLEREYVELDERAATLLASAAEKKRRLPGLERAAAEIVEREIPALDREAEEIRAQVVKLQQRLEIIAGDRKRAEARHPEALGAIKKLQDDIQGDEVGATRLQEERDKRLERLEELEHNKRLATAAKQLESLKGMKPTEIAEVLRLVGIDVTDLLITPPSNKPTP